MAHYQTSITLARPDGGRGDDTRIIGQFGEDDDPRACLLTAERNSENPDTFDLVYIDGDDNVIYDLEAHREILTTMFNLDDDYRRIPHTRTTFDHWQNIRQEANLRHMIKLVHKIREQGHKNSVINDKFLRFFARKTKISPIET